MIIQINQKLGKSNPVEIHETIDLSPLLKSRKDIASSEAAEIDLSTVVNSETVSVTGKCSIAVEFICSRCLIHDRQELIVPFDETFSANKEIVEQDEDKEIHFFSGDQINLLPYVEENLMLGLPLFPLCNEACLGLCPECGQNKNEQPCECKQEKIDPRLIGLKAFFD